MKLLAKIINGELCYNEARLAEWVKEQKDGNYVLEIEKVKAHRSLPQNSLYHSWVRVIADDLGYSEPEEVCRALKVRLGYCHTETDKITGGKKWTCPSTADMNVPDMSEYMTKVDIFAASELNITLPQPDTTNTPYD